MKTQRVRRVPRLNAGVTLLEIMVVVVIMGMIAAVVSKVVVDRLEVAKVELAKAQIREMAGALDLFYMDNGFYPTTEQGLQALVEQPTSEPVPKVWPENGYLGAPAVPKDPWGREYIYVSPGANRPFEIISLGRDGVEGGEGFDADIKSWALSGEDR